MYLAGSAGLPPAFRADSAVEFLVGPVASVQEVVRGAGCGGGRAGWDAHGTAGCPRAGHRHQRVLDPPRRRVGRDRLGRHPVRRHPGPARFGAVAGGGRQPALGCRARTGDGDDRHQGQGCGGDRSGVRWAGRSAPAAGRQRSGRALGLDGQARIGRLADPDRRIGRRSGRPGGRSRRPHMGWARDRRRRPWSTRPAPCWRPGSRPPDGSRIRPGWC